MADNSSQNKTVKTLQMVEEQNGKLLQNLDGRVTGLERDVAHISRSLDSFIQETRNTYSGIRQDIEKIGTVNRPTIGNIMTMTLAVLGVAATWSTMIVAGVWWMNSQSIKPLQHDTNSMMKASDTHYNQPGHPILTARVESLNSKTESRAVRIDRKIDDLEKKLEDTKKDLIIMIDSNTKDRWTRHEDELTQRILDEKLAMVEKNSLYRHDTQRKYIEDKFVSMLMMIEKMQDDHKEMVKDIHSLNRNNK